MSNTDNLLKDVSETETRDYGNAKEKLGVNDYGDVKQNHSAKNIYRLKILTIFFPVALSIMS